MIANYHTHTHWCNHAQGTAEDYIRQALEKGLREIAITDHVPHRQNFDTSRMLWEDFPAFDAEFNEAIRRWGDKIHIIKGFECEYYPFSMENYEMFRQKYGYTFLILGQHTSCDRSVDYFRSKGRPELKLYADEVIEGLETGVFSMLAHPDVALCGYGPTDDFALEQMDRIFAACARLSIPVEINANGLRTGRPYPDPQVWELSRRYPLTRVINSDAHQVSYLCDEEGVAAAERFAKELSLEVAPMLDLG